jgi:TonB family protein
VSNGHKEDVMFETSHVATQVAAQRRYGLLTASITLHSAVVMAFVFGTVSSLTFPKNPPSELPRYLEPIRVTIPAPLGVRAAQRPAAAPQQAAQPTAPRTAVAPDRIPDAVQPFSTPATTTDPNAPIGDGLSSSDVGDPDGVIGSVDVGQQPATRGNDDPDRVYRPVGDVRPAAVLHRVEPQYPRAALVARMSGTVVLECVIDKDGHVRDAHVVRSSFAMFDEPALAALRQWQFAPGILHGRAVDTWFELTVAFQPR